MHSDSLEEFFLNLAYYETPGVLFRLNLLQEPLGDLHLTIFDISVSPFRSNLIVCLRISTLLGTSRDPSPRRISFQSSEVTAGACPSLHVNVQVLAIASTGTTGVSRKTPLRTSTYRARRTCSPPRRSTGRAAGAAERATLPCGNDELQEMSNGW